MDVLEEALIFAVKAHEGSIRKKSGTPYILHPLETAVIVGTMTGDREAIAAAALHDAVEDAGVTLAEIEERFGARIAALVASETEDKRPELPPEESWLIRKQESLEELKNATDPAVKMLWLGDKLSNARSFYEMYRRRGNAFWQTFNQKNVSAQAWYYRTVAEYTSELAHTTAWQEYDRLIKMIFEGVQ